MSKEFTMVTKKTPKRGMRRSRYPWSEIAHGKPLFIKVTKMQQISSTAYSAARTLGVRFTLRKVEGGVEVHLSHEEAASTDQPCFGCST
jgi:hypothetical protein